MPEPSAGNNLFPTFFIKLEQLRLLTIGGETGSKTNAVPVKFPGDPYPVRGHDDQWRGTRRKPSSRMNI